MGTSAGNQKPTVLIVEDNPELRKAVETYFRVEGFEVLTASTIEEAEAHVYSMNSDQFGIALVDIHMWGGTAFGLIREIRKIGAHRILVYAFTGDESRPTKDIVIDARVHRLVIKGKDTLDDIRTYIEIDAELMWRAGWDNMTGLQTRRVFEELAQDRILAARRQDEPLSVLFIDINHFKKEINDGLGHDAGDQAIKIVGGVLRERMRDYDHPFRYGGDEFAVLLPRVDEAKAQARAADFKQAVSKKTLEVPGKPPVTLSIAVGVATLRPGESMEELMARADTAMYEDKGTKAR